MNGSGELFTVGIWMVKPGNEAIFISAWERFARWTSENQPGALLGTLLQDAENPQRFISYGPWRDVENIKIWRNTAEFKAFAAKAKELCESFQPSMMKAVAFSS